MSEGKTAPRWRERERINKRVRRFMRKWSVMKEEERAAFLQAIGSAQPQAQEEGHERRKGGATLARA